MTQTLVTADVAADAELERFIGRLDTKRKKNGGDNIATTIARRWAAQDARYDAAERERNRESWACFHAKNYRTFSRMAAHHAAQADALGYNELSEATEDA